MKSLQIRPGAECIMNLLFGYSSLDKWSLVNDIVLYSDWDIDHLQPCLVAKPSRQIPLHFWWGDDHTVFRLPAIWMHSQAGVSGPNIPLLAVGG